MAIVMSHINIKHAKANPAIGTIPHEIFFISSFESSALSVLLALIQCSQRIPDMNDILKQIN